MKINWKERVKADVERGKRKRIEHQKFLFNQIYTKPKEFEFPKSADINTNRFFFFPKFDEDFCMSLPSIAIYPVLCLQSNFEQNKWFQISQKNIASMAGIDVNTVRKGIKDLEKKSFIGEPFLEKHKQTQGTRHFYVYAVNFIRKDYIEEWEGEYFTFHKCIVDSGVWANLKPRAKALYLSMRMSAHFNAMLYIEIEDLELDYATKDVYEVVEGSNYLDRKWDICNCTLVDLCRLVDITPTNIKPILEQLENHRLIERVDNNKILFKVYLKPRI
ncbi:MAG: hypothetical protein WD000_02380 [Thermodesulfobacteriota bacterium]